MNMAVLNVFDIQRASYHDGPGIRTVVFLKGCNERCFWCQNPESQLFQSELLFYRDRCLNCGVCAAVCPAGAHVVKDGDHVFIRENCILCGRCLSNCYSGALEKAGTERSVDDVMREVLRDEESFSLSGGGVTASGGEPLLQPVGLVELLRRLKERGIHTAIETAGNVLWKYFEAALPLTDLWLIDVKLSSAEAYVKYTACRQVCVFDNLKHVVKRGANVIARTPVIPGVNDSAGEMRRIAELVRNTGIHRLELLPFHKLGSGKYKALGLNYPADRLQTPTAERMQMLRNTVRDIGLETNE